jgi:hypothetical protein
VLSAGTQPHVPKPPGTQASPGGHTPSHSKLPTGPQGALPATHWQSPTTLAQIGVSGGHSPRQLPPIREPHALPDDGQVPPHASQQLAHAPTDPPPVVQCTASRLTWQRDSPRRTVQHVTAPGRPHVERDAHRVTSRAHSADKRPLSSRARATPRAQETYVRCETAPAQSQSASTCTRAAATVAASPGSSPQRARATGAVDDTSNIAIAMRRAKRDMLEPYPRGLDAVKGLGALSSRDGRVDAERAVVEP